MVSNNIHMLHVREESINTLLAFMLDGQEGISATAESRSSDEAIDITVRHDGVAEPVPILIEAKFGDTPAKRREVAEQARSRLEGRPRAIAFGLCYPQHLRDGRVTTQVASQAVTEASVSFAPVRRLGGEPTWRKGTVQDFIDSLRNVEWSRQRVSDAIEQTVRDAAELLFAGGCAPALAGALALPRREEDLRAASLVAALMLSNAALLHHRLRLVESVAEVVKLESVRDEVEPAEAPGVVTRAWRQILAVDFNPVFAPALAALSALEDGQAVEPLHLIIENSVAVADELASLRFDHAGPLYHRLLASARFDGSFYTNHVSAVLLARLALTPDSCDWFDADALAELKIIDPACGTGTLLMAAMHTIRNRHEHAAGSQADSDLLYLALVEDVLHGLDINRHGVQLAACNLTLGNPRVDYRRMNLFTMRHGPQSEGGDKAGSLELLAAARGAGDLASLVSPLPTAEGLGAEQAQQAAPPSEALTGCFDLVIMNPPFTRNDIRNRQYGEMDRKSLQKREIVIADMLIKRTGIPAQTIDQTSVQTFFNPLADMLLKRDSGTFASVVPTTALTSTSGRERRRFLAARFQIETIVTSHDPKRISFSENTAIHESLLIARRPDSGSVRQPTRFVSLARMPDDPHEAILLSDLITRSEPLDSWGMESQWPWPRIREGDWSAAQFYDGELAEAIHDLEALAGTRLVAAGDCCQIGPEGRRIRDAFVRDAPDGAPWTTPILWDHRTDIATTMRTGPDARSAPKPDRVDYAKSLCTKASRLLIACRLYTHQVRVSAVHADEPALGSAWIPVSIEADDTAVEKALCAWWNSTPGVLTLLGARSRKLTYPRFSLDALRALLVPDLRRVNITPLVEAFERSKDEPLCPWPNMDECPTRAVLDQAAARVLRIDGRDVVDWRKRIAREPTVSNSRRS